MKIAIHRAVALVLCLALAVPSPRAFALPHEKNLPLAQDLFDREAVVQPLRFLGRQVLIPSMSLFGLTQSKLTSSNRGTGGRLITKPGFTSDQTSHVAAALINKYNLTPLNTKQLSDFARELRQRLDFAKEGNARINPMHKDETRAESFMLQELPELEHYYEALIQLLSSGIKQVTLPDGLYDYDIFEAPTDARFEDRTERVNAFTWKLPAYPSKAGKILIFVKVGDGSKKAHEGVENLIAAQDPELSDELCHLLGLASEVLWDSEMRFPQPGQPTAIATAHLADLAQMSNTDLEALRDGEAASIERKKALLRSDRMFLARLGAYLINLARQLSREAADPKRLTETRARLQEAAPDEPETYRELTASESRDWLHRSLTNIFISNRPNLMPSDKVSAFVAKALLAGGRVRAVLWGNQNRSLRWILPDRDLTLERFDEQVTIDGFSDVLTIQAQNVRLGLFKPSSSGQLFLTRYSLTENLPYPSARVMPLKTGEEVTIGTGPDADYRLYDDCEGIDPKHLKISATSRNEKGGLTHLVQITSLTQKPIILRWKEAMARHLGNDPPLLSLIIPFGLMSQESPGLDWASLFTSVPGWMFASLLPVFAAIAATLVISRILRALDARKGNPATLNLKLQTTPSSDFRLSRGA